MTTSIQPPGAQPVLVAPLPETEAVARPGLFRRVLLIALLIILVFAATYAVAWFNSYRLSARFISEAEASYSAGEYLNALVGYQEFNPQTNRYTTRGGYVKVEKIWSGTYSWPVPSPVQQARQRIDEIIRQRLTIPDAEEYIRANTGRPAPYFGEIYLRLGELYEGEGDLKSAIEIYESIPDLFKDRPDLIDQAKAHLDRLQ
jgi:tetratricopeptide (TPR) repeat protein